MFEKERCWYRYNFDWPLKPDVILTPYHIVIRYFYVILYLYLMYVFGNKVYINIYTCNQNECYTGSKIINNGYKRASSVDAAVPEDGTRCNTKYASLI